ncbi:MAG TPA: aminopeptidase P family N-terminal domain-containing protein, partial [Ktedonobacteraceae bacterium]
TYEARLAATRQRMDSAGYDALIVYADREHFANLAYLTGFDPRFEEALLILAPQGVPTLLVGNEDVAYTAISPLRLQVMLYQTLSLLSQPRASSPPLEQALRDAGIGATRGQRIGMAGWKYFTASESSTPDLWLEVPAYIVDTLRGMGCKPRNAGAIFMEPEHGLRAINDVDQLASFEFASTYGSEGLRHLLFNVRPGMSEFEVFRLMAPIGLPLSYHPVVFSGERTKLGLASPSSRVLQMGDPLFAALGYWGSNNARGGFLVESAQALPHGIADYVEKLVAPYFLAVSEWYEHIGIGVSGGELFDIIDRHLGDPFFGVSLNPGHLISLDEWVSSPIYRASTQQLHSGMAIQVDVIPATNTAYHTTNIEDGIALADGTLRRSFAHKYPRAWERIQHRRAFMQDVLGIQLKPEVLPFSNIPAYLPPFWLAPHRAMRRL